MEWYDDRALQEDVKTNMHRVLTSTSGNAQSFLTCPKEINEHDLFTSDSSYPPLWLPKPQHPVPKATLGSNDRQTLLRHKHHMRRLKRRLILAQKYLQHPKFLEFRARPRKDVIKNTGEIIWDEETETAFHNAIINIPAMGRKKKSQHGKTLGRNELITEWIKQETGKTRCRKQISSHKQTLDGIFKATEEFPGVPEWRIVSRGTDDSTSECDGPEFYDNSIADMVRSWRMLQADLSRSDGECEALHQHLVPISSFEPAQKTVLNNLEFEMWVSLPDKMEETLHRYTRVQVNQSPTAPEGLENVQGWRSSWPELIPLIDQSLTNLKFEIIQLDASFELMLDFPPPRSKLGISLELDFALGYNTSGLSTSWNCTTHVYQRGRLETRAEHTECHTPGPARVKPPFESKWWAEQFTRLTEKRRHAIDTANDVAIAVADEAARNCLKNLKIMQQISIMIRDSKASDGVKGATSTKEMRTAVLLWSFSQAAPGFAGTTTWRRLIPPPHRSTTNSPLPSSYEFALPSLTIDSTLDATFDDSALRFSNGCMPVSFQPDAEPYSPNEAEELCQDSFMMAAHDDNFPAMHVQYGTVSFLEGSNNGYQNQHAFHLNMQQTNRENTQYDTELAEGTQHGFPHSLFQPPQHLQYGYPQAILDGQLPHGDPLDTERHSDAENRKQALLSFDVNTHQSLQAQLEDNRDDRESLQDSAHTVPTLQQRLFATHSTSSNVGDNTLHHMLAADETGHDHHSEHTTQDRRIHQKAPVYTDELPSLILAPTATRPTLQHHHSFAGVMPVESSIGSLDNINDLHARHDFSLLLDNLDSNPSSVFVCKTGFVPSIPGAGDEFGFSVARPHSQPPPLTTLVDSQDSPHLDVHLAFTNRENVDSQITIGHESEVKIEEKRIVEVQ